MLASPHIVNNLFHLFQKLDPFEDFSFRGFFHFPASMNSSKILYTLLKLKTVSNSCTLDK
jgi:hypothetical protein